MIASFVSALKAEIAQLEDELRDDPRQRKLARLRDALAEYEATSVALHGVTGSFGISGSITTLRTKGDKVKAEITAFLRQRGIVHRKEILRHLTTVGLMGHEKDPMASLAAYLSDWRDSFDPDGSGNWSLKKPPGEGPLNAAE